MKKSETPHIIRVSLVFQSELTVENASCTFQKRLGGACGHLIGLLYQVVHHKGQGLKVIPVDVAKTSLPQLWDKPGRSSKISGQAVQDMVIIGGHTQKVSGGSESYFSGERKGLKSTLYNPLRNELGSFADLRKSLSSVDDRMLILPTLDQYLSSQIPLSQTKFWMFPKELPISVQQKLHSDYLINVYDGSTFPKLPLTDVMKNDYAKVLNYNESIFFHSLCISEEEIHKFEELTRLQSATPLWSQLRGHRITASKMHDIFIRRKDPEPLVKRMKNPNTRQTKAMKEGIAEVVLFESIERHKS